MNYTLDEFERKMLSKGVDKNLLKSTCNFLKEHGVKILKVEPKVSKINRPVSVPQNKKHDGIVDVRVEDALVILHYDKDEDFIKVVKDMGFKWEITSRFWYMRSLETTGTVRDIVAEIGNRLLNEGFSVCFDTQELLKAAVNSDYTPIFQRWVLTHPDGFELKWGRRDDFYKEVMSIKGAKYYNSHIVIPEKSWAEVFDFAEKYEYRYTEQAKTKMKKLSDPTCFSLPKPVKKAEYNEKNILQSSREILEDLQDED